MFVAPQSYLTTRPVDLFGSDAWISISFQDIYDEVIENCLSHESISSFGKFTLHEYVKTLKYHQKRGEPLAITQTDRAMVQSLFERHEPAVRALYEILAQVNDEFEPLQPGGSGPRPDIKVQVDNQVDNTTTTLQAASISKLYAQALEYLHHKGCLDKLELPLASDPKRYLLAMEPKHQQGNSFLKPVSYQGYVMEANKSRDGGLSDLSKLFQACGLSLKIIS